MSFHGTEKSLGRDLRLMSGVSILIFLILARRAFSGVLPHHLAFSATLAVFAIESGLYALDHYRGYMGEWRRFLYLFLEPLFIVVLVHLTGGTSSPVVFLLVIHVMVTAVLTGGVSGYLAALVSILFYTADIWAEFYGWLPVYPPVLALHVDHERFVFTTVVVQTAFVAVLLLATAMVAGKLKGGLDRERRQLVEANEEQKRLTRVVEEHKRRLQQALHRLTTAQEEERKKVARDVHDQIGQAATLLHMTLQRRQKAAGGDSEDWRELRRLTDRLMEAVQGVMTQLRPPLLDELGLVAALEHLTETFQVETGVAVDWRPAELPRLDTEQEVQLFRIAQEALFNVRKHAAASRVQVALELRRAKKGELFLEMVIADDGRGFAGQASSHGLTGMQERATMLGGELEVHSRPGRGTRVTVTLPLRAGEERERRAGA